MRKEEYFIGLETLGRTQGYSKKRKRRRRRSNGNGKKTIIIVASVVALALLVGAAIFFGGKMCTEDPQTPVATPDETTVATVDETTAPTEAPTTAAPTEPPLLTQFDAPDDGSKATPVTDTLFLYKGAGYNLFGSSDKIAKHYSTSINKAVKSLDKNITVYNIVVPNHTEYGVPQKLIKDLGGSSQAENILTIEKNLDDRIIKVNAYDVLAEHSNEYLYFNTDHHWTGLGAYYGYTAFCKEAGLTPMDIKSAEKHSISGFTGSFCNSMPSLFNSPDTVDYYSLPVDTYAYLTERGSDTTLTVDVYYPATAGTLTYGVFCWGDVEEFIIHSSANTGKKVALVKDSYGNAFAPYLATHYDEVHLIDFRYWNGGDFKTYLKNNGITDVIILNNTMSANSPTQVDTLADKLS